VLKVRILRRVGDALLQVCIDYATREGEQAEGEKCEEKW